MRQAFEADFNAHNKLDHISRLALLIPISELQVRLGFTIEKDQDELDYFLGAYFESAGIMAHAKERHRSYPGVVDVYLQHGIDRMKFEECLADIKRSLGLGPDQLLCEPDYFPAASDGEAAGR